jgi:hypothetical protein
MIVVTCEQLNNEAIFHRYFFCFTKYKCEQSLSLIIFLCYPYYLFTFLFLIKIHVWHVLGKLSQIP